MSEKDDVQLSEALRAKSVGTLDRKVLEFLVCPVTKGGLRYDASTQELCSMAAEIAFPIRDGIAILLVSEARSLSSGQTE